MSEQTGNPSEKKDFFISYRNGIENDKNWALWVRDVLHKAGLSTIMQAFDFKRTTDFIEEMHNALVRTKGTIAILSKDYFDSMYCTKEFFNSYHEWAKGKKDLILLKIDDYDHEGLLSTLLYYRLFPFSDDEERATSYLLSIIEEKSDRDPGTLKFPGKDGTESRFPGTRAIIWNLPLRNPQFTGREELLQHIHNSLTGTDNGSISQLVALIGLGGIGKTETATEYGYRHSAEYDIIWWIGAETTDTLISGYTQLLDKLDPDSKSIQEQYAKREKLRELLETCEQRWLLIFDNAVKMEDIQDYLPRQGNGRILITSRERVWDEAGKCVNVEMWDRSESVKFIMDRTGLDDGESADVLARELGDYPLALAQAAAYIVKKQKSIKEYLDILKKHGLVVFNHAGTVRDYKSTVAKTWLVSFNEIKSRSPQSIELLNLLAFFAPDDIPMKDIIGARKSLPESLSESLGDDLSYDDTRQPLISFAFVEIKGGLLSIHRLVQEVVRENLSEEEYRLWADAALRIVNDIFPDDRDKVETWDLAEMVLPHALSVLSIFGDEQSPQKEAGWLHSNIGLYLQQRARFEEAVANYRRALRIIKKTFGQDNPEFAEILSNLGLVQMELGFYIGAKANFERALEIQEKTLGPDDEDVARDLNNLGEVLRHMGDLEGAKANFERALGIIEKVHGPDHPYVATAVNNLGLVLFSLGDYDGAKESCERALKIDESEFGPDHPKVGIRINNVAGILRQAGDYEGAKSNYESALRIFEKTLGPGHPNVAIVANNLGKVFRHLGDYESARAYCERALKVCEEAYGPDHPSVATDACSLGEVLEDLGDFEGARINYERAMKIFQQSLGPDHPDTKSAREKLDNLTEKMKT